MAKRNRKQKTIRELEKTRSQARKQSKGFSKKAELERKKFNKAPLGKGDSALRRSIELSQKALSADRKAARADLAIRKRRSVRQ